MNSREDAVRAIEAIVLAEAEATAVAGATSVRMQVKDEAGTLQVTLSMGEPSTVILIEGHDVDRVMSDAAARQRIQRKVQEAAAVLRHGSFSPSWLGSSHTLPLNPADK